MKSIILALTLVSSTAQAQTFQQNEIANALQSMAAQQTYNATMNSMNRDLQAQQNTFNRGLQTIAPRCDFNSRALGMC